MSDQFEKIRLGNLDSHTTIWRYFTFPKFISLLVTQALWFSKLSILEDTQEGTIPELTRAQMKSQDRDIEEWFPDERRKQQVRRFVEANEEDGRELIIANCWFIGEHESQQCGIPMSEIKKVWPLGAPLNVCLTPYACPTSVGGWAR